MELDREGLIKVFESCVNGFCLDTSCPYVDKKDGDRCNRPKMYKDIIALINSQEQRIKELTEENEKLKKAKYIFSTVDYCSDDLAKALEENKRLTEENERLRAERDTFEINNKDLKYRNKELQKYNRRWAEEYDEINRVNESLIETIAKLKGGAE